MAATVIYSFDHTSGGETFDGSGDDFIFQGVYPLVTPTKNLGIIFVPKDKVSDIGEQPASARLTEVKDLQLVAYMACYMGWDVQPDNYTDEKGALLKDYGYDLVKEYKDYDGILAEADKFKAA